MVDSFTEFNQTLSSVEMVVEFATAQPQEANSHPLTVRGYGLHKYFQREQEAVGRICPGF